MEIVEAQAVDATQAAEWDSLFEQQAGTANPFLAREWALAWYDVVVPRRDRLLLFLRHTRSADLVGVAAYQNQKVRVSRATLAQRLVPVGSGLANSPVELPGVLAREDFCREVTRAVVAATTRLSEGWAEIALGADQRWFEPEWLYATGTEVAFYDHQRARACVVLDLDETWDATRSSLKRNVKESIRRSANRIKKDGRPWEVRRLSGAELDLGAIDRFLDLHRARASSGRATVNHHDAYESPVVRRIVRAALPGLAGRGLASIFELVVDGRVLASQLALHAPGTTYMHSSGFDQEAWELGPVTLLHTEVIRHAIERGDHRVNFSPGPNVSKLRWSETMWTANDFVYGSGGRSLKWRFLAYAALSGYATGAAQVQFARDNATPTVAVPSAAHSTSTVERSAARGVATRATVAEDSSAHTSTPSTSPNERQAPDHD